MFCRDQAGPRLPFSVTTNPRTVLGAWVCEPPDDEGLKRHKWPAVIFRVEGNGARPRRIRTHVRVI